MVMPTNDDFRQTTTAFLTWFRQLQGENVNSKVEIVDMRNRKAGRGIGKLHNLL